jgi:hypothetical protein
MASASAAERSQSDPALRNKRGQQVVLTFSQQGTGNFVNGCVILIFMVFFAQTGPKLDGTASRNIIMLQFAVAAAVSVFMTLWRYFRLKESEVWKLERADAVDIAEHIEHRQVGGGRGPLEGWAWRRVHGGCMAGAWLRAESKRLNLHSSCAPQTDELHLQDRAAALWPAPVRNLRRVGRQRRRLLRGWPRGGAVVGRGCEAPAPAARADGHVACVALCAAQPPHGAPLLAPGPPPLPHPRRATSSSSPASSRRSTPRPRPLSACSGRCSTRPSRCWATGWRLPSWTSPGTAAAACRCAESGSVCRREQLLGQQAGRARLSE